MSDPLVSTVSARRQTEQLAGLMGGVEAIVRDWIAAGKPQQHRLYGWLQSRFDKLEVASMRPRLENAQSTGMAVDAIRDRLAAKLADPGRPKRR
ncbi:MAG: hypothetical protein JOY66_07905 [Acetobacteraceae bacterium]|nr:hypothetical protein [Acetobacteraceae bacterium]